jgi:hypothetical protein
MARPRQRGCLDIGLRLDVNSLLRSGMKGIHELRFSNGKEAVIDVHMDEPRSREGWLHFRSDGGVDQRIDLAAVPRHFGGRQWYWLCPMTGERASVLWKPHGSNVFASQRYWKRRRLAYRSQFLSPTNRAHLGIKRIETRLGKRENDDTLYKPKWQRLGTFNRLCEKIDEYESVIDERLHRALWRIISRR